MIDKSIPGYSSEAIMYSLQRIKERNLLTNTKRQLKRLQSETIVSKSYCKAWQITAY